MQEKEFAVGDRVLLSSKNVRQVLARHEESERTRKLLPRFLGPFTVLKRIGPVAYQLDLSDEPTLQGAHNVFHVSLLREYQTSPKFSRKRDYKVDIVDGEEHVAVEAFLDHRLRGRKKVSEYLVQFADDSIPRWLPESNLREDMPDAINDLIKSYRTRVQAQQQHRVSRKPSRRGNKRRKS